MSTQSVVTVTGVDMGSATVKIAAVVKGGVEVIVNEANLRETPNVVGLGQKERLIGQLGKLKLRSNHANTVLAPTRLLGFSSQCPYTSSQMLFTPAKLQKPSQQIAFSLLSNKTRQTFVPEQLVAAFITEMETTISQTNHLQNKNMVIAIPGYLTKYQRKAMLDAIQIARKEVKNQYPTQLVSEEVAVSMEYGYNRRAEFAEEVQNAKNVLFIDLGHSKCNIYLTAFNKQYFRVLTSAFDRQLGCKYMDWELLKFCASEFDSKNPNLPIQLMQSKKAIQKLLQRIQKQRKILSGIKEVEINAECLLEGQDFNYSMTRQQFENICSPVVEKFKKLLEEFINSLKEKGVKIDSVELVGGGTRIPVILDAITAVIGEQPSRTLNSNQCIAKGAALISAMNSIIFKAQPYSYFQNYQYNVGLKVNGVKYNKRLIERNEILTEREKIVQIEVESDIEKLVLLAEYEEGETEEGLERRIFQVEIDVKEKKKRKGSKGNKQEDKMEDKMEEQEGNKEMSKVELHLTLEPVSKLLNFTKATSPTLSFQTVRTTDFYHLTPTQLHSMQTRQKQLTLRDLKIKRFYNKKNEYESTCYKLRQQMDTVVSGMGEYVDKGKEQEVRGLIQKEVGRMEEMDMDHIDTIEQINKRQKELKQNINWFINSVTKLKQQHELLNHQLKTLSQFIQSIISTRTQNNYPQLVNQTGEWINQIFNKLQTQPKNTPPPVTPEEVSNMRVQLENGVKQFDLEQQRKRVKSYKEGARTRQHQQQPHYNPTGTFFRPQTSSYNPFGGRSYYSPYENPNRSNYNPGGFWDRNFF